MIKDYSQPWVWTAHVAAVWSIRDRTTTPRQFFSPGVSTRKTNPGLNTVHWTTQRTLVEHQLTYCYFHQHSILYNI